MSIITDLYATLNTNAGVRAIVGEATSPQHSRIYHNLAPESAAKPLITFFIVSDTRMNTIKGVSDQQRELVQISCHENTYEAAQTLADAVYSALEGNGWQSHRTDLYDPSTQTHSVHLDWILY